jgi:hypothetical protein
MYTEHNGEKSYTIKAYINMHKQSIPKRVLGMKRRRKLP